MKAGCVRRPVLAGTAWSAGKDCCTGLPVQGWGLPWKALQVLAPGRGLHCLHIGPVWRPDHVK